MLRAAFVTTSLVLASSQAVPATDSDRAGIQAASQAWSEAFNTCDPAKLAALYPPDAVLWGTFSQDAIPTPAGIRQYFDRACSIVPPIKVTFDQQLVRAYADTAINSGKTTFTRIVDGEPRLTPGRYSFTYRNVNGQWLIADHHSSVVPGMPQASSAAQR